MENQSNNILKHLQAGKSITQLDALNKFNCFRLGARIYDLKQKGYPNETKLIKTPSGKMVAEYSLTKVA